jgi:FkbM family methyltransferase
MKRLIRDWLCRRLHVPRIPHTLRRLKSAGFIPQVIFDVGAYHGEFARYCMDVFGGNGHKLDIVCFEPLQSALNVLKGMEDLGQIRVIPTLLGSRPSPAVTFHEMETASSVLEEHFHQPTASNQTHAMTCLDEFASTHFANRPIDLIKVDTQGYELEILRGAATVLPRTRALLLETNLIDIHKGVPLLHELVSWLAEHDFVAYDIAGLTRRPLDNALWQADIVFIKQTDPLRRDKRYG